MRAKLPTIDLKKGKVQRGVTQKKDSKCSISITCNNQPDNLKGAYLTKDNMRVMEDDNTKLKIDKYQYISNKPIKSDMKLNNKKITYRDRLSTQQTRQIDQIKDKNQTHLSWKCHIHNITILTDENHQGKWNPIRTNKNLCKDENLGLNPYKQEDNHVTLQNKWKTHNKNDNYLNKSHNLTLNNTNKAQSKGDKYCLDDRAHHHENKRNMQTYIMKKQVKKS